MRSSTHCLKFRAGLDVHVRKVERLVVEPQRDSRDGNQPKICCAHDSAIEIAAFPEGALRRQAVGCRSRCRTHTRHSSERNIGPHMLRATYAALPVLCRVRTYAEQT